MKRDVFIDCHAGLRDAVALAIVRNAPEWNIVGVSECYREAPLPSDLSLGELIGALDIGAATATGSTAPIQYRPDGPTPQRNRSAPPKEGYAWDLLYEKAKASGELTVLALGPLTNLAIALFRYEDLPQYISRIIVGAGSSTWGDVTAFAERSVYEDASACQAVLQSGVPVALVGINAAAHLSVKADDLRRALCEQGGDLPQQLAAYYAGETVGDEVLLLSAAAAAVLADDSIADLTHYHVVVERSGSKMYGRTVVDWRLYEEGPRETQVADRIDATRFKALLNGTIKTLS